MNDESSTQNIELRELRELKATIDNARDTHRAMAAVDTMAGILAADLDIVPEDDLALIYHVLHARLRELIDSAYAAVCAMIPPVDLPF